MRRRALQWCSASKKRPVAANARMESGPALFSTAWRCAQGFSGLARSRQALRNGHSLPLTCPLGLGWGGCQAANTLSLLGLNVGSSCPAGPSSSNTSERSSPDRRR